MDKTITTESLSIIQKTQPKEPAPTKKLTVAESENIGANHLGFAKSLFQHYSESVFNFYVNEKIAYLLGTATNTESARETFYNKLIQNSSLPTNYNFTSIITKINKEIEHHTQQRYSITYASKGKKKLQTLVNYLSLLATSEDALPNTWEPKQKQLLTNIPPVTVIEDKSLAAIFSFKIEELTETPLFSKATLKEKPITAMYMDAKIDGQSIKLILDSRSVGSIITRQFMDQLGRQVDRAASTRIITTDGATKIPIGEIDNLPIKINGIIVPIKVLVMEATQYQPLVGNDWLFKINVTFDWNTQELQLSQNELHTYVPATCGHFKPITMPSAPLIKFKEEKKNLPGKHTKSFRLMKTTISYHQYFLGMTREKRRKTKNLPGILTKTGELIMIKMNQQTENEKKLIRERKRRKKKKLLLPAALIVYMLTLQYHHPIIIDQN
ncbi:hypothetical protein G9A89_018428 [Geosiphon pyriformis]|nr:hypothetical protein G9A89_018428 [Geosiphon pyriformis]